MPHALSGTSAKSACHRHRREAADAGFPPHRRGPKPVISDDHAGLGAARLAALPGATWQRCQCHLQRNAFNRAPTAPVKKRIGAELREVWNAPGIEQAQAALDELAEEYRPRHPKFADWLEHNAPEGLAVLSLPEAHRRKMRTTNGIARSIQQELKRRTRKIRSSPAPTPSCASLQASLSRSTRNGSPERPMSNGKEKMTDRQQCTNFQTSLDTIGRIYIHGCTPPLKSEVSTY